MTLYFLVSKFVFTLVLEVPVREPAASFMFNVHGLVGRALRIDLSISGSTSVPHLNLESKMRKVLNEGNVDDCLPIKLFAVRFPTRVFRFLCVPVSVNEPDSRAQESQNTNNLDEANR